MIVKIFDQYFYIDLKKAQINIWGREVRNPGSHGSTKWWIDDKGNVRYDERPKFDKNKIKIENKDSIKKNKIKLGETFEIDTRTDKEKEFCSFIDKRKFNGKIYHNSIYLNGKKFNLNEKQESFLRRYLNNEHIIYVNFDENKRGLDYRYSIMLTQEGKGIIDSIFTFELDKCEKFLRKYNLTLK